MDVEEMIPCEMSENIQLIADWMRNDAPFNGRTDRSFIINFLSFCSNDVEKAKQRIGRYYELRRLYPNLLQNRDVCDEKIKKIFLKGSMTFVTNASSTQPIVYISKFDRLDSTDSLLDSFRVGLMIAEVSLLESPKVREYGCISIHDFQNMSFNHVMQFSTNIALAVTYAITEGIPVRQLAVHCINVGFILRQVIYLCKFAMPAEIRNIMHVHSGGWECLSGRVPAECLPIEYGGTNGTIQDSIDYQWSVALTWREYLLDDEKYGYLHDK